MIDFMENDWKMIDFMENDRISDIHIPWKCSDVMGNVLCSWKTSDVSLCTTSKRSKRHRDSSDLEFVNLDKPRGRHSYAAQDFIF